MVTTTNGEIVVQTCLIKLMFELLAQVGGGWWWVEINETTANSSYQNLAHSANILLVLFNLTFQRTQKRNTKGKNPIFYQFSATMSHNIPVVPPPLLANM